MTNTVEDADMVSLAVEGVVPMLARAEVLGQAEGLSGLGVLAEEEVLARTEVLAGAEVLAYSCDNWLCLHPRH